MIYTAITNNKDVPRTDITCLNKEIDLFKDPCRNARMYKILSHQFINNSWSIWTDGNIFLKKPAEYYLDMLGNSEIGIFKHCLRDCIYQEALECIRLNVDEPAVIIEQMRRYKSENYPENGGLAWTAILVRKHTDKIKKLNEQWWSELCRGSRRDQLSCPYVFRDNIKYFAYDNDVIHKEYPPEYWNHELYKLNRHKYESNNNYIERNKNV